MTVHRTIFIQQSTADIAKHIYILKLRTISVQYVEDVFEFSRLLSYDDTI